ncbi:MAG: serine hydrolase [Rhodothermales bacterium]|nr:serine hydrolase [Rhodothermales bacterium]
MKSLQTLLLSAAFTAALIFAAVPRQVAWSQDSPWPTDGWAVSTPDDVGLNGSPIERLIEGIGAGSFGFVDRLVVVKNGRLIVDEYWEHDYRQISRHRRSPLGCGWESCPDDEASADAYNYLHPNTHPYYHGSDVHSLQSITKSIASTVIGVAIQRGEIEGVGVPLLTFFDGFGLDGVDPRLHDATLEDLLTMRSGIEWHEQDRPLDETNTTLQLERSEDWIRFTLDQPMDAAPGTKWVYNSGGSHLMSGVIRGATGQFIDEYAERYLFGPLGISEYHWKKTPTGYPDTEGGLYLEAQDLARIGLLYLRGGIWDDRQIVDPDYIDRATARHVEAVNGAGWGYGYQWWRVDRDGVEAWAGLGFGGQYLLILPAHDLVGVVNSWNLFDRPDRNIMSAFVTALIESASD